MFDHGKVGIEDKSLSDSFLSMLDARLDWLTCSTLIHSGLPWSFFCELGVLIGISPAALGKLLGVKVSTRRGWMKKGILNAAESDRLYRTAVVINAALGLCEGNRMAAREWLTKPAAALGQYPPVDLFSTFVGIKIVEGFIWKIEHGVSV